MAQSSASAAVNSNTAPSHTSLSPHLSRERREYNRAMKIKKATADMMGPMYSILWCIAYVKIIASELYDLPWSRISLALAGFFLFVRWCSPQYSRGASGESLGFIRESTQFPDPILQAQIQVGLLQEEIGEMVSWGYYPDIGSAVLIDEKRKGDGDDGCLTLEIAPSDGHPEPLPCGNQTQEMDFQGANAGAFKAFKALAPIDSGHMLLQDVAKWESELYYVNLQRKEVRSMNTQLESFAYDLSHYRDGQDARVALDKLFHLKNRVTAYTNQSAGPAISALEKAMYSLVYQIPKLEQQMDAISREVDSRLAALPQYKHLDPRFLDAARALFLPSRSLGYNNSYRRDIKLANTKLPSECLRGLILATKATLETTRTNCTDPYYTQLIRVGPVIQKSAQKLSNMTPAWERKVRTESGTSEEQLRAQIDGLSKMLMDDLRLLWAELDSLQATEEDTRDFERQVRFYWPKTWWEKYTKGEGRGL